MTLTPTLNIFFQKMCNTVQIISNKTKNNNLTWKKNQIKTDLLCKHRVFDADNVQVTILDSLCVKFKHSYYEYL